MPLTSALAGASDAAAGAGAAGAGAADAADAAGAAGAADAADAAGAAGASDAAGMSASISATLASTPLDAAVLDEDAAAGGISASVPEGSPLLKSGSPGCENLAIQLSVLVGFQRELRQRLCSVHRVLLITASTIPQSHKMQQRLAVRLRLGGGVT